MLLTGRMPQIVDAFLITASGKIPTLRSTKLLGMVDIDPKRDDFFRVIVEERQRLASRTDLSENERKRLNKALKILASATSYGIWAQMDRLEGKEKIETTCYGLDPEPFPCQVANPDVPGEFCFPPLASLITGGARLMLAMLEHCISDLGGEYAMEDTDSMAIVATEHGGLVPCFGGPFEMKDGRRAIKALSWQQVNELQSDSAGLVPTATNRAPSSKLNATTTIQLPVRNARFTAWQFRQSVTHYFCRMRTVILSCCRRASTITKTGGLNMALAICETRSIPRVKIATGFGKLGSTLFAHRCVSRPNLSTLRNCLR